MQSFDFCFGILSLLFVVVFFVGGVGKGNFELFKGKSDF